MKLHNLSHNLQLYSLTEIILNQIMPVLSDALARGRLYGINLISS